MQPDTGRNVGPQRNEDEEEVHAPGGQKRTQETTKNVAVSKGPASLPPCRHPVSSLYRAPISYRPLWCSLVPPWISTPGKAVDAHHIPF